MRSSAASPRAEVALVVAAHGRRCIVRLPQPAPAPDQPPSECAPARDAAVGSTVADTGIEPGEAAALVRGRDLEVVVGDRVRVLPLDGDEWLVEGVLPRTTELLRSVAHRRKVLAANVDLAALVIAPDPSFSEEIALRVSMAAHAAGIPLLLVANKIDSPNFGRLRARLQAYARLGYDSVAVSAREAPEETRALLTPHLRGRATLLLGESGMGKSTLLNALVPDAGHRTAAISQALGSGRHTTTFTRAFRLPASIAPEAVLIDSPGFQQFGLAHLSRWEREHAMPEFDRWRGQCRFNDCHHRDEPGCAIRAAVERGDIDRLRYRLFIGLDDA